MRVVHPTEGLQGVQVGLKLSLHSAHQETFISLHEVLFIHQESAYSILPDEVPLSNVQKGTTWFHVASDSKGNVPQADVQRHGEGEKTLNWNLDGK